MRSLSESAAVAAARPHELGQAFALAFRHLGEVERTSQIDRALGWVRQGQLDTSGVLVLRDGRRVRGSVVCQMAAGRTGLIWPPQVADGARRLAGEDLLAQAGKEWLSMRGARVFQAMLSQPEAVLSAPLLRNGFSHITTLRYLRHFLDLRCLKGAGDDGLCLESYLHCDREIFHRTLLDSYAGSLDCPELNGRRTLEDIIAGHRAQGQHDPEYWWLARIEGQPVGVLLATLVPEYAGFDVAYMGVVPQRRRQGIGARMLGSALEHMKSAGGSQVILAVDARNRPALELYARLHFEQFDLREVFLCFAETGT